MNKHIKRILISLFYGLIFFSVIALINYFAKNDDWLFHSFLQSWGYTLGIWLGIGIKDFFED